MSIRSAEAEVIWYLENSDTDACGLRTSAANVLEEKKEGTPAGGGGSRGYQPRDFMPEHAELSRKRLRRIHVAMTALPPEQQAVLYARYLPRGKNQLMVPGLGELTWVGELLVVVRRRASEKRITPHDALRELIKHAPDASLREDCAGLVTAALERLDQHIDAHRAEADLERQARLTRDVDADSEFRREWLCDFDKDFDDGVRLSSGRRLT